MRRDTGSAHRRGDVDDPAKSIIRRFRERMGWIEPPAPPPPDAARERVDEEDRGDDDDDPDDSAPMAEG